MSTLSTNPVNKSFLSNNKFDFALDRIPNLTFHVQSATLPGLTLQSTTVNNPFVTLQVPGNQITFNALSLSFIVDEEMRSWYEIYDWIVQLGNPQGFNKRGRLFDEPKTDQLLNVTSDATLFIKTNSNNPKYKVNFIGMFPTDLSEIAFSTTDTQEFVTCTATFNYTYYTFEAVT